MKRERRRKKKRFWRHFETGEKDSGHFSVVSHRGFFVATARYQPDGPEKRPPPRCLQDSGLPSEVDEGNGSSPSAGLPAYVGAPVELRSGLTDQTKVWSSRAVPRRGGPAACSVANYLV